MHRQQHASDLGTRRLTIAIAINLLLSAAQVTGGLLSGSLALVADALHNFTDAAGLVLALVARRISRLPPDAARTFGYGRAEVVGGLINLTATLLIAAYLLVEAGVRLFERPEIDGWTVVIVAGVALVVDTATSVLTYSVSDGGVNLRAAFLHNLADALASLGVIASGTLVILFGWHWTDLAATAVIAAYIAWMSWMPLKRSIRILMQSVPEWLSLEEVSRAIEGIDGVRGVFHVHLWPIDERVVSLEARVRVGDVPLAEADGVRRRVASMLEERFGIDHATIEIRPDTQQNQEAPHPA